LLLDEIAGRLEVAGAESLCWDPQSIGQILFAGEAILVEIRDAFPQADLRRKILMEIVRHETSLADICN
jgi:hypothetical protein